MRDKRGTTMEKQKQDNARQACILASRGQQNTACKEQGFSSDRTAQGGADPRVQFKDSQVHTAGSAVFWGSQVGALSKVPREQSAQRKKKLLSNILDSFGLKRTVFDC
ncbi:hypothetical protein WMY93_009551 [Mugilogobius chulae]|uniref:Small EDRK-rich factor-like N-terminal domain-containing protein n=1 Tax=Mugilogobius chulae TaxID=88201 RepID=A0AAW0PQH8_9GOBI